MGKEDTYRKTDRDLCSYICVEYYSAMKKNEILPFGKNRCRPRGYYLSELSKIDKDTICCHSCRESKNLKQKMNIRKKKQTHRYREHTRGHQWGEGWGGAGERKGTTRHQLLRRK